METVLLTIHALVTFALITVVMLQRSEGGALGIGGGSGAGGGMFTARGAANALTRMTTVLGAAFIVTSLALAVVSNEKRDNTSVLDKVSAEETTPPQGTTQEATNKDATPKQQNDGTSVPVSQ